MSLFESNSQVKVSFSDLDPMNIVWHGNYLKYLEFARGEMFEKLGFGYMAMHANDVMYPIAKMDLKYIASAKLHDVLNIKCSIEEIEPAIIIKYLVTNAKTGQKLFKATSLQICVTVESGETLYIAPQKLKKCLEGKIV